ncbi:hypothetical protein HLRTI_000303 [Halorhabdus tiamatea SARL4B]|uniref:Uncharacterized protein n=1 Tax=Halorhabdus tiamatea SARL4B TaxID=1033806 RepID=F7PK22_9EURY|nr:hypothetical protein [Halorhabdus tiamatea]ERJ07555.1 hypothetical protein HLRTI_000303 [Halorhabdus tiamatea SARL4B]CCQ33496.1 hypothetical protein HTIA_1363 [Halorhabdus tiamatea SARL4B]
MNDDTDWNGIGPEDLPEGLEIDPAEFEAVSEEMAVIDDAIDALSAEQMETIEEVLEGLDGKAVVPERDALFADLDTTPEETQEALDILLTELEGSDIDLGGGPGDDHPAVLDTEQAERFLELYGRLLVYVNDRFDVVVGIDTYEEFSEAFLDEIYPIRERLYEGDAEAIIADFLAENPAGLSESELEVLRGWRDYEFCEFAAVVEHREEDTVFVEPEAPQAFAVTAIHDPFEQQFPEPALPVILNDLVMLPFEGEVVPDGWLLSEPLGPMMLDFLDMDIETAYGEAKHSHGIAESLPPGEGSATSDAERLRFYTKNEENRERFADEIEQLRNRSDELAGIYHEQMGKAQARRLGREFRDLDLREAHVAIYDGQVVATAPTEDALKETLSSIMPEDVVDHPYIYHYDP